MDGINWDPAAIMEESMRIIEGYMKKINLPEEEKAVIKRVVHTSGDPSLVSQVKFSPGAVKRGIEALRRCCNVYTDVNMVRSGVSRRLLSQLGGEVYCDIASDRVADKAKEWGITRAAAAMRLNGKQMDGQVVAIGNAPTALFEILSLAGQGICRPALVVGVPVGFVGAAESKEALVKSNLVYITLPGTRGGSPIAAAIVNALLHLAVG